MSKKGPLSKAEKFYIENNSDMTVDDIASDLNRSTYVVGKYMAKIATDKADAINVSDLMARKEDRGVTIMTPNASQVSDETRSTRIATEPSRQDASYIIKKDK